MSSIANEVLSLPRRERRVAYLAARRADKSVRWEPFRRWDGGKPNILHGFDLLKVKAERKAAERAAATMTTRLFGKLGLAAHRMFRLH